MSNSTQEQFDKWYLRSRWLGYPPVMREAVKEAWQAATEVQATEITRLTDEVKRLREALENSTDLDSIMEQQLSVLERRKGRRFGIAVAQDEPARQWQVLDERATRLRKSICEALKESQ